MRARLWDEELGIFCDMDVATGERVRIRTSAGLTPLAAGIDWPDAAERVIESLLDTKRFWTPYPVPSLAGDEAGFDPHGEFQGVRVERPRNGRTWVADSAMALDALAGMDSDARGPFRRAAAQLLQRIVRMHFQDGVVHAPQGVPHMNPLTGHVWANATSGECFSAWLADVIVRYAAGISPTAEGVRVDPLPLEIGALALSRVRVRGHELSVELDGNRIRATLDGAEHRSAIGEPIELPFGD
jgi:hypothetical protein